MRYSLIILVICTLSSCAFYPQDDLYSIPLEHFGSNMSKVPKDQAEYSLRPNDSLDILYHFNTIQSELYKIAPHDKINIKFISVPEYDNIYQVRPDGYFSLPLLGDIKAKGKTVPELQQYLAEKYKNILKNPAFFVSLAEFQVQMNELRKSLNHPNWGQARLITVRHDYKITMPLIGELSVLNKTLKEITVEATSLYDKKFPGMSVDILLRESQPQEIYVFGEVKKPGSHTITKDVSLFTAIALSGGANDKANLDAVVVLRKEGNEMVARPYNFNELLTGKSKGTILGPDDIVYVPRSRLSSTAQIMDYISQILLFRGFDLSYTYRVN